MELLVTFIVFGLLMSIAGRYVGRYYENRCRKILEPIAVYLNASVIDVDRSKLEESSSIVLKGIYKGKSVSIEVSGFIGASTIYIKVFNIYSFASKFRIDKKRGQFTKFFIGKYIKTGEPNFDDNWAVKGYPEEKIKNYFSNIEFKNIINELMNKDYETFEVKDKEISLYNGFSAKSKFEVNQILFTLDKLCRLSGMIS